MLLEASAIATRLGLPQPCAAQLPYSLVHRSPVEDASMRARSTRAARRWSRRSCSPAACSPASTTHDPDAGRAAGTLDDPRTAAAAWRPVASSRSWRDELDTTPAGARRSSSRSPTPSVASVLFGATRPEQVHAERRRARPRRPSGREATGDAPGDRLSPAEPPGPLRQTRSSHGFTRRSLKQWQRRRSTSNG